MITVGLVVEGPHDYTMLQPLISKEIKIRHGEEVVFRQLQPMSDAIGKMSSGGWSRVVSWCQANSGDAIDTFFTPLFAGVQPCNVIVIHLDGDALELIQNFTSVGLPTPPPGARDRAKLIGQAIEGWLNLDPSKRTKFAFAIPVLQSEAWILAAEQNGSDLEQIHSKNEFQRSYKFRQHGALGKYYSSRVKAALQGYDLISARCESFVVFKEDISALQL